MGMYKRELSVRLQARKLRGMRTQSPSLGKLFKNHAVFHQNLHLHHLFGLSLQALTKMGSVYIRMCIDVRGIDFSIVDQ